MTRKIETSFVNEWHFILRLQHLSTVTRFSCLGADVSRVGFVRSRSENAQRSYLSIRLKLITKLWVVSVQYQPTRNSIWSVTYILGFRRALLWSWKKEKTIVINVERTREFTPRPRSPEVCVAMLVSSVQLVVARLHLRVDEHGRWVCTPFSLGCSSDGIVGVADATEVNRRICLCKKTGPEKPNWVAGG